MRAATWHGDSRFTIDDLPEPTPGPGQALVAVHTAGICGSDVHAIQGLFPLTPPRVMGHEYSGTVLAVGKGVSAPGAEIIDGAGMLVLPGLIETHWHMWGAVARNMAGPTENTGYFYIN